MLDFFQRHITIQSHRGGRAHWPENSMHAFEQSFGINVDAIEIDVIVTADHHIVVSHDPWAHHHISFHPDGKKVTLDESQSLNFYKMTKAEVQRYICGLEPHFWFDNQTAIPHYRPDLQEVAELFISKSTGKRLNIEIKSQEDWDNTFHPEPKEYARIFLDCFLPLGLSQISFIQSFDARLLNELYSLAPQLHYILLSETEETPEDALLKLHFLPEAYAPKYLLIDENTVLDCSSRGIPLVAWTVNELEEFERLYQIGVRHFITDYPIMAAEWKHKKLKELDLSSAR
jgi:glycerophosphoryl diester phosphodiesterase